VRSTLSRQKHRSEHEESRADAREGAEKIRATGASENGLAGATKRRADLGAFSLLDENRQHEKNAKNDMNDRNERDQSVHLESFFAPF
jgi:hypothetical protein